MAVYKYRGLAADGREVSGKISADHKKDALRALQRQQIRTFDINQVRGQQRGLKSGNPKRTDYFQLLKQFSVLVDAEVAVLDSIESLKRSAKHKKIVDQLATVSTHLRAGMTLGDAMAQGMPEYPNLVFNLIKLGEKTGRLAPVMAMLSDQLDLQEKINRELRNALTYPAFLIAVGISAVIFMFYFVVPRFAAMIGDSRDDLPLISEIVFSISETMTQNTPLMIAIAAGIIVTALAGSRSGAVRSLLTRTAYRLPIVGRLMRMSDLSNWTRTVGISVDARSHLLDAVELANLSLGDPSVQSEYQGVTRDLRSGVALDEALKKVESVDPTLQSLVSTGVKSGRLAEMLLIATETLDTELRSTSERVGKLAEPISILSISLIIGTVVIALVTSMTSLYSVSL